jgi:excisionase family DNA binding protein
MLIQAEVPDEFVDGVAHAVVERVIDLVEMQARENQYMDVSRAALYLCCSKSRIYDLARRGEIPSFKFGGRLLFSSREIDESLAARRAPASTGDSFAFEQPTRKRPKDTHAHRSALQKPRAVPPPLSFGEQQKDSAAKALGLSRNDFDQLSPREYDLLWKQRVQELGELTKEQKEALFAWDPNVQKLGEMPVSAMRELAQRLLNEGGDSGER